MKSYNNGESRLRIKLKEKLSSRIVNIFNTSSKIDSKYVDELFNVIADINNEESIFTNLEESLESLAYNIFYTQIYYRIDNYKNDIITEINESSNLTRTIIGIIKESAEELDEDKKQAFYKLIGNNYMIMASLYKYRKNFYDSSINILCKKADVQKLHGKITLKTPMVKLFELTESEECSRLQRVLDILMKYGNNLIITGKYGIKRSNHNELGLSNDDIYSLSLLTKIDINHDGFIMKFMKSIYGLTNIKEGIDHVYNPIYNLHSIIYNISNDTDVMILLNTYENIVLLIKEQLN
ncbi:hypothetical protein NEIRO03_2489, partial [Nematocida sp. AWRm78]